MADNTFYSILFKEPQDQTEGEKLKAPDFFGDLNCHQIVEGITADAEEYNLKPFFYAPLKRTDAIAYRHEVMRDLENPFLLERVNSFARKMRVMRRRLVRGLKISYKEERQAWFLESAEIYCGAIDSFTDDLARADLKSHGFLAFHDYLKGYAGSARFALLSSETKSLKADLSKVKYSVLIKNNGFTVRKYGSEPDYSAKIEKIFERFKQNDARDYSADPEGGGSMNHIEGKIVEFVAKLYPGLFSRLDEYCIRHSKYVDKTIAAFDREIQFYVAYLNYISPLKQAGLDFCYPRVSEKGGEIYDFGGFDIALARKLIEEDSLIVCNDFQLMNGERIMAVSGPNQGGKTTFARAFGQLHYFGSLGLTVPGNKAQLLLFDKLFTHFEKEEAVENLRGKLEDDLMRIHNILDRATPRSIIVLNEIFASTTLHDEIFLSRKVMEKISAMDALCVWVTFVEELISFNSKTVSMVSTVDPENPATRTFKIVKKPADGLAYAVAIARKYRLTYDLIKKRIQP